MKNRIYIAIDLKSFYASVECIERGLDPLTTNLVVADASRTEKTRSLTGLASSRQTISNKPATSHFHNLRCAVIPVRTSNIRAGILHNPCGQNRSETL